MQNTGQTLKRILLCALLIFPVLQSKAQGAADEEGPLVSTMTFSPTGPLKVGDILTITLTMYDPGGTGIRNTQLLLKDKFGRQHTPFNDGDWNTLSSLYASGTTSAQIPFKFLIDETWGSDGWITLSNMRAYDKIANGTYFYDDGATQNLQSGTSYADKHPLANFRIAIGNPPPDSSASATTTTTTTLVPLTTPSVITTISPTVPMETFTTIKPNFPSLKVGATILTKTLISKLGFKSSRTTKITLSVSKTSQKYCKVVGSRLQGKRAGTCRVVVTSTQKSKKKISKTAQFKIFK